MGGRAAAFSDFDGDFKEEVVVVEKIVMAVDEKKEDGNEADEEGLMTKKEGGKEADAAAGSANDPPRYVYPQLVTPPHSPSLYPRSSLTRRIFFPSFPAFLFLHRIVRKQRIRVSYHGKMDVRSTRYHLMDADIKYLYAAGRRVPYV